jgi:hypothetical protein
MDGDDVFLILSFKNGSRPGKTLAKSALIINSGHKFKARSLCFTSPKAHSGLEISGGGYGQGHLGRV